MPTTLDTQQQKALKGLLEPIFDSYQEYACSDGRNFAGNIGCVKKAGDTIVKVSRVDWDAQRKQARAMVLERIEKKTDVDKEFEASAFGATLGAAHGYTKEKIKAAADNIDAARSAVCTTFAVSGANKLLELQNHPVIGDEIKRIEIIARKFGHRGTHCYVILNRREGSDLKNPSTWGDNVLVVDPWLSSLQNPSVYNPREYDLTGFLGGKLECNFDSTHPNLMKERRQKRDLKRTFRNNYIQYIKEGDKDKILRQLIALDHQVESLKLGKGHENLFTQALKYNQTELFKSLWEQIKDPDFAKKYGDRLVKAAIANNNHAIINFLHSQGVDICKPKFLDLALDMAIKTGDDNIFATIFKQEYIKDPLFSKVMPTLAKLPLLNIKQGLNINQYLSYVPRDTMETLVRRATNTKVILQTVSKKLQDIDTELKANYPHAFEESSPTSSPSSSRTSSPTISPRSRVASGGPPPPPPKLPPPEYFKTAEKPKSETELSLYRIEKTRLIEQLKEKTKAEMHVEVTNEMIAQLGDYIDNWDKQSNLFSEFFDLKEETYKLYESEPDKENIVNAMLVIKEYESNLDSLLVSIDNLKKEMYKRLTPDPSTGENVIDPKRRERFSLFLAEYQKKLDKILTGVREPSSYFQGADAYDLAFNNKVNAIRNDLLHLSVTLEDPSKSAPALLNAAQAQNLALVKNLLLTTTHLAERNNEGKTFLDYLSAEQTKELVAFLLKENAAENAYKIALLKQDLPLIKKIQSEHDINLFEVATKNDLIWNYLPKSITESSFSKLSYFFSKETFEHFINQAIKDEINHCQSNFKEQFRNLELDLMEINETLIGIREPRGGMDLYMEGANQKIQEVRNALAHFESKHQSILNPINNNLNENTHAYTKLKAAVASIHTLLKEIEDNSVELINEEKKIAKLDRM